MPSEVYAEDIEALLERLDGVAAARVVATGSGEIDRVYVTAEGDEEESAIRRAVASAMMSAYSLAIDAWRIRVARLRPVTRTQPRWYIQRVEEVLTATDGRIAVELLPEGAAASLTGRARGQLDGASRLRTAAQATLDALKSWLEGEDRRAAVEAITPLPLATGRVMVVMLSLAGPASADRCVGSSLVEGSDVEAVIAATLDALGKRGAARQRRRWMMRDRHDELESMEAHVRRLREPQRMMPRPTPAPAFPANCPPDNGPVGAGEADEDVASPAKQPVESGGAGSRPGGAWSPGPPASEEAGSAPEWEEQDESVTLEQIRPERPGGAQVAQSVNRPDVERGRFAPKSSMEDDFIKHLISTGALVHIRCRDGYEITDGVLKDLGTYTVLVETRGGQELVFKHGIISIRPLGASGQR